MKQKARGIVLAYILLTAIIFVIALLIIGIEIVNKTGKKIADMEAKTEDILAVEKGASDPYADLSITKNELLARKENTYK